MKAGRTSAVWKGDLSAPAPSPCGTRGTRGQDENDAQCAPAFDGTFPNLTKGIFRIMLPPNVFKLKSNT